jgi:hypothetical protein
MARHTHTSAKRDFPGPLVAVGMWCLRAEGENPFHRPTLIPTRGAFGLCLLAFASEARALPAISNRQAMPWPKLTRFWLKQAM